MSVNSRATASLPPPTERDHVVHWTWRDQAYELVTGDQQLLDLACAVWKPWRMYDPPTAACRWKINGCTTGWQVTGNGQKTHRDTRQDVIRAIEFEAVADSMNRLSLPGLHAALLAKHGRGILIIGPRTSGKSTLACALWRAGWSLLCDDAVFLDSESQFALASPRRISLRHSSRSLLGPSTFATIARTKSCHQTSAGLLFHPFEVDGRSDPTTPVALCAAFFLNRSGARETSAGLSLIPRTEALLAAVPYSNLGYHRRFGEALRALGPWLNRIPAFDLQRDEPDRMVRRIEIAIDGVGT